MKCEEKDEEDDEQDEESMNVCIEFGGKKFVQVKSKSEKRPPIYMQRYSGYNAHNDSS